MVEIVKYNDDNLKDDEIDEVITRIKIFIVSSKNNIMIGHTDDGYQLIGGNVPDNMSLIDAVKYIVFNECGIEFDSRDTIEPFYEVRYYNKDYMGTGKNRLSDLIFFVVGSDKLPNYKALKLSNLEMTKKMPLELIRRSAFVSEINAYIEGEKNPINQIKAKEILMAFDKYKEIYKF